MARAIGGLLVHKLVNRRLGLSLERFLFLYFARWLCFPAARTPIRPARLQQLELDNLINAIGGRGT
jgi:hypothetical protein